MIDNVFWWVVIFSLVGLNYMAMYLKLQKNTPLWLSGIIIGISAPVIGYSCGYIFGVWSRNLGESSLGAAFSSAALGAVILANGILYLIIGIILEMKNAIVKVKNNED